MNKTNLYWQVYKNLEREFLSLAEVIHIDDHQLKNVYSMRIADLLVRAAVEIESLAKHLYVENGGQETDPKKMYFDTTCMAYLNSKWCLESKVVLVVSPNLYLEKDENIIITPLKNAQNRSPKSAKWNEAYQAVKHDRQNSLTEYGRLIYLLQELAALYILNLYNKDEQITKLKESEKNGVDASFGSKLFSVKVHNVQGLNATGEYLKAADFDECIYLQEYESETKQRAINSMIKVNDYMNNGSQAELEKLVKEKLAKGEEITEEWAIQARWDIIKQKNLLPIKDYNLSREHINSLTGLLFNVVLNKNQY